MLVNFCYVFKFSSCVDVDFSNKNKNKIYNTINNLYLQLLSTFFCCIKIIYVIEV